MVGKFPQRKQQIVQILDAFLKKEVEEA